MADYVCRNCERSFKAAPSAGRLHCSKRCRKLYYEQTRFDLTPREKEVLELIAKGWTNPKIARHFDITVKTVKTHCEHIYQKLGAYNRPHAVAIGILAGVIELKLREDAWTIA